MYKYNQIINFLNWASVFLIMEFLLFIYSYFSNDYSALFRYSSTIIGIELFVILAFNKEYRNRYVEFHEDYVKFNSFRISGKVYFLNVKYEDIIGIYTKKIPFLGINSLVIKAKNLPGDIKVTWRMNKHKELFVKIYESAKGTGETEYIDDRLVKIAEEYYARQEK